MQTSPCVMSKDILPTSSVAHKIAPFKKKSHVKCHCLKSASITADIVKCKVPGGGEEGACECECV